MKKQRILFLGSKPIGYHCLEYLISQGEELNFEIVGIMTNSNKRFGEEFDLNEIASKNNISILTDLNNIPQVDIIYSVQYHEILKPEHLAKAQKIAVNLHMAPLPEYRGCNQFTFALLDAKKEFGTTVHVMDCNIDHGDIVAEKRFPIPENCWIQDLYDLTFSNSIDLFKESLPSIVNGTYSRIQQTQLELERGCSLHFRNEINDVKVIDLNWEKEKIERHLRATSMPGFEPPFAMINNQKVYLSTSWH